MSMTIEWGHAPDTAFYTIGRLEEAPDHQSLKYEPEGTIGLLVDGGSGGGYCLYGQPEEIIAALARAIREIKIKALASPPQRP